MLNQKIFILIMDYTYDTIIGKEFCKEVKIFQTLKGYSTTNIIKKSKAI